MTESEFNPPGNQTTGGTNNGAPRETEVFNLVLAHISRLVEDDAMGASSFTQNVR